MWWTMAVAAAVEVKTATYELRRGDDPVPVRATWPAGDGELPIIVFSHGMGGSSDGYAPLATAWAEAGFLVLQPTHPDTLKGASREELLAAARDPASFTRDPARTAAWDERPAEVALVLDHLEATAPLGVDPARLRPDRVGIGGHSFGSHTAMRCGGLTMVRVASQVEPRADALLLLSPQGPGGGFGTEDYGAITLPTLVVTGSEDVSPRGDGQGPEWRLEAFRHLGSADRWLLWLEGAHHDLGGISGVRRAGAEPSDPELLAAVIRTTTDFWNATLRADPVPLARLDSGATGSEDPRVRLTRGRPGVSGSSPAP